MGEAHWMRILCWTCTSRSAHWSTPNHFLHQNWSQNTADHSWPKSKDGTSTRVWQISYYVWDTCKIKLTWRRSAFFFSNSYCCDESRMISKGMWGWIAALIGHLSLKLAMSMVRYLHISSLSLKCHLFLLMSTHDESWMASWTASQIAILVSPGLCIGYDVLWNKTCLVHIIQCSHPWTTS